MKLKLFLEFVEKRPQMYFDKVSLENLNNFLGGYFVAKQINNILDDDDNRFLKTFYSYLKNKYNLNGESWKDLLLDKYQNDDIKAFHKFFEHFAEFNHFKE